MIEYSARPTKESEKSAAIANQIEMNDHEATLEIVDNRPGSVFQRKLRTLLDDQASENMISELDLTTAQLKSDVIQRKPPTANQLAALPELRSEVEDLCEVFEEDKEEFAHAVKSQYNTNLEDEGGGVLEEYLEEWLPEYETYYRKLAMIPARAAESQASFTRLKRQLALWYDSLKDKYSVHVERFWDIYHAREAADEELMSEERDELNQITEADERYFRWYLNQSKSALSVYRGDGRGVNEHSLEDYEFEHIMPGGTKDISFRGVVEHTHTNTLKNGMVSTTSDFAGAHHWATSKHKYGIVYEMRPANYINVTELLNARNFKERYPGQYEILTPGPIDASEVVRARLYQKNTLRQTVINAG